jgi:protein-S-isoprenylcysteine O-methyltransferase Ste14
MPQPEATPVREPFVPRLARWAALTLAFAAAFVLIAGRWDLPWMWAWLAVFSGVIGFAFFILDPDLRRERFRPGGPSADPAALALMRLSSLGTMIVALLDIGRFHWSDSLPAWLHLTGLVLFAGGSLLPMLAMSVNRFFSPVVRIQEERGHRLVDRGPYAVVRHPGYAGMAMLAIGGALLLGSLVALAPALVFTALVLRRVGFEDAFLRANLEGYREYAERVRFRLFPGVW